MIVRHRFAERRGVALECGIAGDRDTRSFEHRSEVTELDGQPARRVALDLRLPVAVARFDPVEVRVEVRALEVPRRGVHLVEEVGAEHGPVDDHALGRVARAARGLVGEHPDLDAGAALGRIHRLVPRADENRDLLEHECLPHAGTPLVERNATPDAPARVCRFRQTSHSAARMSSRPSSSLASRHACTRCGRMRK